MAKRIKPGEQGKLALVERNWGGKRKGAGRKPKQPHPWGNRPGVRHLVREEIAGHHPVHVTLRLEPDAWNLRSHRSFRVLAKAFLAFRGEGSRLTHFSVQGNHIHLILEVESRGALSQCMRSFCVRAAKGLNKMMGRVGRVFADRYHVEVLRCPRQVRNAVNYVLSNTRKHLLEAGVLVGPVLFDEYAAGPMEHVPPTMRMRPSPLVQEPRTWLLRAGWERAAAA